MKALITGGAGFIGSNLAIELLNRGDEVIVIDRNGERISKLVEQHPDIGYSTGEIMNTTLTRFRDVDVIFHQAAITDTTVNDMEIMAEMNISSFTRMLTFANDNNIKFVYASSASVYGDMYARFCSVNSSKYPLNEYAASKLCCDVIAQLYIDKGYPIVGLRYFNVYGNGEAHKGKMASMVYQLAQQMMNGDNPKIFTDGEQRRDWVYIKDVVKANVLAVKVNEGGIYNIGAGKNVSFNMVVDLLNDELGTDLKPKYIDNLYEEQYQNITLADIEQSIIDLNYVPQWPFENAIKHYVQVLRMQA